MLYLLSTAGQNCSRHLTKSSSKLKHENIHLIYKANHATTFNTESKQQLSLIHNLGLEHHYFKKRAT